MRTARSARRHLAGPVAAAILLGGCSRCNGAAQPADGGPPAMHEAASTDAGSPAEDSGDEAAAPSGADAGAGPGAASDAAMVRPVQVAGEVEIVVVRSGNAGAQGVLLAARPRLRACYERALAQDPSVKGEMALSVGIGDNGSVGDVAVGRSPLPSGATRCFTRAIAALPFGEDAAGSRVDVKLRLSPRR